MAASNILVPSFQLFVPGTSPPRSQTGGGGGGAEGVGKGRSGGGRLGMVAETTLSLTKGPSGLRWRSLTNIYLFSY